MRRRETEGRRSYVSSGNQSSGRETTLIDNEVYNLITTISSKLEGIAAYQKYERDGQANDPIWQELRQQDE
jgi:hypothetical protein